MEEKCKNCIHFQMGISYECGVQIFNPFEKSLCMLHKISVTMNEKCKEFKQKTN